MRPLSFGQRRLWILQELEPGNVAYDITFAVRLSGALDVGALRAALAEVVRRHDVLRTALVVDAGEPVQAVEPDATVEMEVMDLLQLPDRRRRAEVERVTAAQARTSFDLTAPPLLRATLLRVGPSEHVMLLTVHHLVSDAWSFGVLVREMVVLYRAFREGRPSPLPPLAVQYADYAEWQRERLDAAERERLLSYWRERLDGAAGALRLPADRSRPSLQTFRGGWQELTLSRRLTGGLKALARREGATPFMVLLAAFQAFLRRHTGQDDVSVGVPIANRRDPGHEGLIGFFLNTLVLRTDLGGDPTFGELLGRVRRVALGAFEHQDLPFEMLVEALRPRRDPGHGLLFNVMLNLQNAPIPPIVLPELRVRAEPVDNGTAKFDLTLSLNEAPDGMDGALEYNADLFDAGTAERLALRFHTLLEGAVADPARRISRLPLLPEREREDLRAWSTPRAAHPAARVLHELFEAQARRAPDAVAVVAGDRALTYGELDARANGLAHRLRELGAGPEALVGLRLERSPELVVAILAALKAGAAYLPLDPAHPPARLAAIVDEARAAAVVTRDLVAEAGSRPDPPGVAVGPRNAAYVIHTSGSTGTPKGVVVEHAAVTRLFEATGPWFDFGPDDVWTLFHSPAFDFSVWELWGALLHGGRLVVVPPETARSPEDLGRLLRAQRVTVLNQTPTAMRELLREERGTRGAGLRLRHVILGGEALDPASLGALRAWPEGVRPRLVNMYGITETTVHVTLHELTDGEIAGGGPGVIGVPIPDLAAYVLDEHLEPLPVGVPGELYVAGAGLARGYLGRPGTTAERFLPDPHGEAGSRMYRTGDLGRWRGNGELEFVGRADAQVEVRGFRVEPGEVEAVLTACPGVRAAAVAAHDQRLVAYVVGEPPGAPELRAWCRRVLPEYMVPAVFVALERLPVTASGKLDRRRLADALPPTPDVPHEVGGGIVEELARVWAEVLGLERVGAHDNFFDLGGDSIRSIQARSLAMERGMRFSVQDLFLRPTVADLAELVAGRVAPAPARPRPDAFDLVGPADRERMPAGVEDAYPMTKLQAGMLFHSELSEGAALFHDVESFHLRGPLEPDRLGEALDLVAARHPVLRTSFDLAGYAEPLQLVWRTARVPLAVEDLSVLPAVEQDARLTAWVERERRAPFDWARAPLARFTVHRRAPDRFQLTMAFHHAILDGWSMFTLLDELSRSYLALVTGGAPRLDPPPLVSMRHYVGLEREALACEESRDFWRARLEGSTATSLAVGQQPACTVEAGTIAKVPVPLAAEITPGLQASARELGVPLKSLLLAAHLRVVAALSGQSDVVTGVVSHGRPEEPDGDRAAGLFLNTLPLRMRLPGGSWAALARAAFAAERELLPHRWYPMAELQRLEGRPLFETVFNYTHYHVAARLREGFDYLGGVFEQRTDCRFLAEFSLDPLSSELNLHLSYHADVLGEAQVRRAAACYARALTGMVRDPLGRSETCGLLPPDENRRLLVEWPEGPRAPVPDVAVHSLFEAQARRSPEAVAVSFGGLRLTYGELDRRADGLARLLRAHGAGPESLVALCAERSLELVVAILAVLKAGAAYVPIDPGHPDERLASVLADLRPRIVLTQERLATRLRGSGARLLCLDGDPPHVPPETGPPPVATGSNLACVIFTSGSSGVPKGVAIEHRSIVNLLGWAVEHYDGDDLRCVLAASSICFDCVFFELLAPLSRGGTCVLARSLLELPELPERDEITLISAVPGPMAELLEADGVPATVRTVNLAGDVAHPGLVRRLYERTSVRRVLNLYGPSEDTTYATCARVSPDVLTTVSIGRPIANTRVWVLDGNLEPVPEGVSGELYVAGAGLARGYLGRPAETAERFLPAAFGGAGERMYRTGDVARWVGGELEFVGRLDEQVKVRGYRVELGEVESVLRGCAGVREAVVVKAERGLLGYVVLEGVGVGELRGRCEEVLPAYMVPVLVEVAELPRTVGGKVDRSRLSLPPAPAGPLPSEGGGVGPRTREEEVVAGVWCEVLGLERVGVFDDFFDLGGDSLQALRVSSAVARRLGWRFTVKMLLERPTVAGIVERGVPLRPPEGERPEASEPAERPHLTVEHRPLVGLLTAGRIPPVDAAALCTPSDLLPILLERSPEAVIEDVYAGLPSFDGVLRTGLGSIAIITVPRFNRDLYEDREGLLTLLDESLELARHLGARVATLTDLLASATDYGRALPSPAPVAVSTGHATTAATVILTMERLLAEAGRDFADETVGFLGLGSIGATTLRLALRCLPHPRAILLADLYSRTEALERLRDEVRTAGFAREVSVLGSRGTVPDAFYAATYVVGATNVPDVLDVDRLRPGAIVADDSGPHCFAPGLAIRRLAGDGDILFAAAGRLQAPEPIHELRHVPRSVASTLDRSPVERGDPRLIEGCVLSSLLSARFDHLPPVVGVPDGEAALGHLRMLRELGFRASPLQCTGYPLPDDAIAAFRSRFGHTSDQRRPRR